MTWSTNQIRQTFLNFLSSKEHAIEPSAPIVIKDDPTLMFTNAGMNQFKSIFVGNSVSSAPRIANSQKCLRVSGKHNDLVEVGRDHYHHTMFEMLGNWSFDDYFKSEAIAWAWELLTEVYKLDKDRLYVSVFSGDKDLNLTDDNDARQNWSEFVNQDRILGFGRKENFWEMGDTGPCGPCSEIHYDMRAQVDRDEIDGSTLVNKDHPEVIEIWNLVFMQYELKKSGDLVKLDKKYIDTGMGLERLSRVLQGVGSNYDIDLFRAIISNLENISNQKYSGSDSMQDVAFRVIADHLRAVSFCIADGQLPASNGAGYVIRRVLRRAIRFGYSYLDITQPSIYKLVETLCAQMGSSFNELEANKSLIEKVIEEEEKSFQATLEKGLNRLDQQMDEASNKIIAGDFAFELYDTYGFPIDLTMLIAEEHGFSVDIESFEVNLKKQKDRSRDASKADFEDWNIISNEPNSVFIGYDQLESNSRLMKFRKVKAKGKELVQVVLDKTPFYPEGGGQLGDRGLLSFDSGDYQVIDTKKENDEIIHFLNEVPEYESSNVHARVNKGWRSDIIKNHSATHLLHFALREELGTHVEQKGSMVAPEKLRFDFSHFEKISEEQIMRIQSRVNEMIDSSIDLEEYRNIPISEAKDMGAMALFGEKYGDEVRAIKFGDSIELCGGTHVSNTSVIDGLALISESSVASGVRRVEAVTGRAYNKMVEDRLERLKQIETLFPKAKDIVETVARLKQENALLKKEIEVKESSLLKFTKKELISEGISLNDCYLIQKHVGEMSAGSLKGLVQQLIIEADDRVVILGARDGEKVSIAVGISKPILKTLASDANQAIKSAAGEISGGGGGQNFLAMAGGTKKEGLNRALQIAYETLFGS